MEDIKQTIDRMIDEYKSQTGNIPTHLHVSKQGFDFMVRNRYASIPMVKSRKNGTAKYKGLIIVST